MKKIFFILFSLIMMCSVSFGIEANVDYKSSSFNSPVTSSIQNIGSFSPANVYDILVNYGKDSTNTDYINSMNLLVEELENQNLKYVIFYSSSYNSYYLLVANSNYDVEFVARGNTICFFETSSEASNKVVGYLYGYARREAYYYYINDTEVKISSLSGSYNRGFTDIYKASSSIPTLTSSSLSSYYYWDGSTYSYELPEQGGSNIEVPELTDEELAELVTRFENSDAKLSNNAVDCNDYFITYDTLTGYYRAYTYVSAMDLSISYGNYDEEGNFINSGTTEGEAWQIHPYCLDGNIFLRLTDWLASKQNSYSFRYFSISPDSSIEPRYIGQLEYSYCSNYIENEVVVYTTKPIILLTEETDEEGNTKVVVTEDFIPKTTLTNSETGEEIIIEKEDTSLSNTLFSKIASVIKGGFEGLLTGIKAIFVPSEDFLSDKANQVLDKITFYTSLQSTFDNLIASMTKDSEGAPQITVDFDLSEDSIFYGVGSANVLDFSWYEPYKPVVDLFIIAFVYGVFIYRFIIELPNTISGLANAFEYEPTTVTDSQGEHFAMKERHTGKIRKGR